jgi:hypothetical protein
VESGLLDDEDRAGDQNGSRAGSESGSLDANQHVSPDKAGVGVTADDADATAGNTGDDGSAKRRKKAKKQGKGRGRAGKRKDKVNHEDKRSDADLGGQQGMDEGWPDDADEIFGDIGDDGEDLSGDSLADDIFVSSAARFELVSQGAIFSSVVHGSGREAPVGSLFITLHEEMPGARKNLFPVCLYQVAQTPSDPEGLRRAARVVTSFPDISSTVPSKRMSSEEVAAISLPHTHTHTVHNFFLSVTLQGGLAENVFIANV